MYDESKINRRPNARSETPEPFRSLGGNYDARVIADYYAHITAIDEQLGRLLDTLDAKGLSDDTIVVFTSDHGDMLWSQGMFKKEQPFEESVNIPFIVRYPGVVPAGHVTDTLLSTVDFMPSLLGLMGMGTPDGIQGSDLSHAMRGEPGDEPSSILLTLPIAVDQATAQNIREWRGIRTKWYTYARWFDGDGWILYDNDADPFQLNNRIDDPAMAGLRKTLDAELNEWLAETDDRSLSWDDHIRELGLADVWNDRERHMHPKNPRLIRT